jgi:hypothetical protein
MAGMTGGGGKARLVEEKEWRGESRVNRRKSKPAREAGFFWSGDRVRQ